MKSMRRPIARNDNADVMPISSSLPNLVFHRLEDAANAIGVTKAMLIRRAVCRYLQDMEQQRIASLATFERSPAAGPSGFLEGAGP